MLAIEIRLNSEVKGTYGANALNQLVAMLSARRGTYSPEYQYLVECVGVRPSSSDSDEVLRWLNVRVALGDEVAFKVVEVAEAREPFDSQLIASRHETGAS